MTGPVDPPHAHRSADIAPDDESAQHTSARLALGIGVPLLIVLLGHLPLLLLGSELPDPVASHFDGSGTPNGSMSVATFALMTSCLMGVGIALCIAAAFAPLRHQHLTRTVTPTIGFLGGFLGALGAAILASTVLTQRGLDDWTEAGDVGWSVLFTAVAAAAIGASAAWLATRTGSAVEHGSIHSDAALDLADGEVAVWTSTLRSNPLLLLGLTATAVGLVVFFTSGRLVGGIIAVSGIALVAFATVHVRVDQTGLRVTYGWLSWPTTKVDIADVLAVRAIDVRPLEWGGWGYRGSLKLMRRAAVVHRAGPGIRLDLHDDKVFVITVDDAATGAALLAALMERAPL